MVSYETIFLFLVDAIIINHGNYVAPGIKKRQ